MYNLIKKTLLYVVNLIVIASMYINVFASENQIDFEIMAEKTYLREQLSNSNIGDIVIFGKYEQNGILHDGKEPIEWIVLQKDKNNDSAILISKYILDCYPFNGFNENVTWETCSLRKHMNTTMLIDMFNEAQLTCVLPTFLINSKNIFNGAYSGEATYDYLFIPGIDEMLAFLSNDNFVGEAKINELVRPNTKRMCYATAYAKYKGVRVMGDDAKYPGTGNYFLRTSGLPGRRIWYGNVYADYFQSFVSEYGEIKPNGTGITSVDDGIRPMVQISY